MQAADHISTGVPHLAPIIASGLLYCLVWMSLVKCRSVHDLRGKNAMRQLFCVRKLVLFAEANAVLPSLLTQEVLKEAAEEAV